MYRRDMRLLRNQANSNQKIHSRFISHIANFPAVLLTWSLASNAYKKIKSSSQVLNKTLTRVETVATFVSQKSQPLLKKLEPQIKAVDDLALRGIESLEGVIPVIARQPEKVIRYTRCKYNQMIETGLQKYDDVKGTAVSAAREVADAGAQKSSEYFNTPAGQLIIETVNTMFDSYEMYLDRLLPPLGDSRPELAFGDRFRPPVLQRADLLTERLRERFYKHVLLYLQNIRIRGKLQFAKIYHANMVNFELCRT